MEAASAAPSAVEAAAYTGESWRYRRIIIFFTLNFLRLVAWEIFLRRLLGENRIAPSRERRLRGIARRFRALAVEMGGVMIKLGQFISTRVDILPESVIKELAGLQDEVPAVAFSQIETVIHEELGVLRPHLSEIQPAPLAAASFGQVHRALLDGEKVVVKVQRPGIRGMVYTDLAALGVVARFAMRFGFIARRADVPVLLEEFGRVLWEELDYRTEAQSAQRFRQMFSDDRGVYIPKIHQTYSSRRVLVMEDVTAIKISDYVALEAAGISRQAVARRLLDTYLTQVFIERFFHADPHPGNIFIYPLDESSGPNQRFNGAPLPGKPFYLIYIDFGMMGNLSPQIVEALRQTMISVGLRDARGMVESYERLGVLMPGADKERLIDATRRAFEMVWGRDMNEMAAMSYEEMAKFGREFSDLLFSMPFRVPQDLIYLGRCLGILAGMCTGLDARFDPWQEIQPYVRTLLEGVGQAAEESGESFWQTINLETLQALLTRENVDFALRTGGRYAVRAMQLPLLAEEVLRKADRGELQTRLNLDDELQARFNRLERGNRQLVTGLMFGALAVSGSILWVNDAQTMGGIALALACFTWVRWLLS
jgi:predicted unusual protein kinase regulating ubiquinone biosynthesis (AarF/ABC1/UbiB family)